MFVKNRDVIVRNEKRGDTKNSLKMPYSVLF